MHDETQFGKRNEQQEQGLAGMAACGDCQKRQQTSHPRNVIGDDEPCGSCICDPLARRRKWMSQRGERQQRGLRQRGGQESDSNGRVYQCISAARDQHADKHARQDRDTEHQRTSRINAQCHAQGARRKKASNSLLNVREWSLQVEHAECHGQQSTQRQQRPRDRQCVIRALQRKEQCESGRNDESLKHGKRSHAHRTLRRSASATTR